MLSGQLDARQQEWQQLKQANETLEARAAALDQAKTVAEAEAQKSRESLTESQRQLAQVRANQQQSEQQVASLRTQLAELQQSLGQLQTERDTLLAARTKADETSAKSRRTTCRAHRSDRSIADTSL